MNAPRICADCGQPVPPGQRTCTCVARRRLDWLHSRETILLVSFAALALAFVATGFAARFYHGRRRALGEVWLERGAADLRAGRAPDALTDLRTALIYARQEVPDAQQQIYSLDLGQALLANGRPDEAQAYLLDLWQRAPDNANLNLELARIAVAAGDDAAAKRYYANAVYGIWEGSSDQVQRSQRETQLELCRYLIGRNETTAAQAVLLAVAASLPPDPALHSQVGGLMLSVGAVRQALAQFQEALKVDRRDYDALVGVGRASFDLGDDRTATRYLEQASREKSPPATLADDPQAAKDLAVAEATLALNPFQTELSTKERARRVAQSYKAAVTRLEGCIQKVGGSVQDPLAAQAGAPAGSPGNPNAASGDLLSVYKEAAKMRPSATEAGLARHPPDIDSLMGLVFRMESAVTARCGAPIGADDAALSRIAQRVAGTQP